MKKILIIFILIIPSFAWAQHDHFDNMVSTLTSSGNLDFSLSMRTQAQVESYADCTTSCTYTSYDLSEDATSFNTASGSGENFEIPDITDRTTGTYTLQYETKLAAEHGTNATSSTNCKFVRIRDDNGSDPRLFDLQGRYSETCNGVGCPGFLFTIRCYECSPEGGDTNPLVHPTFSSDAQPGGDTADRGSSYDNDDHLASSLHPFLHRTGVWIRVTLEWDMDTSRLRVWMSDEDNATVLVFANPSDSNEGYSVGGNNGLSEIRFNSNFSTNSCGNGVGGCEHWHRNLIVGYDITSGELTSLIAGQPGESTATTTTTSQGTSMSGGTHN